MRNFGPNVVSFIITSVRKRWYGVGAYVPPNDLPTINWIRQVLECGPKGVRRLIFSDLKVCLANPRDQQEEQISTVLAGYGLTDQTRPFLPRRMYQAEGNWTWRMWREGGPISGRGVHLRDTIQLLHGRPRGT